VAVISMVVIGLSAGQVVWALLPAGRFPGWPSVIGLGVAGSVAGGMVMSHLLHGLGLHAADFHALGLFGSMAGTAAFVSITYLHRNSRS
jgi:uncharacterized membrane protein YeaQ/YmgE (transglycosylase-associated protein family)